MARMAVSDAAHEVIAGWSGGKPVVALMGEFSSGKSTLLNFMLDQEAAPTRVTATPLPPTWFVQSDTRFSEGVTWDGQVEEIDLTREDIDFRGTYAAIRKGLSSSVLDNCDIIDAPGISDPDLAKDALRFMFRYLDLAVWCTPASQAWRQSEKAIFEKLAQAKREKSVLVITRIDKLRNKKDQAKVLKRVRTDAGPLFGEVVAIQTPKAAAIPIAERVEDPEGAWVQTGGHDFETAFTNALAKVSAKEKAAAKPTAKAKPKAVKPAPSAAKAEAPKVVAKPSAPAREEPSIADASKPADEPVAVTPVKEALVQDASADLLERLIEFKSIPANGPDCEQIDQLIAAIQCDNAQERSNNPSLQQCMKIENDDDDLEPKRLVSQIGRELRAFSRGGSVRIDI